MNRNDANWIVVSGCPRSGTSLMMHLILTAVGEDRIYGSKFPQEPRMEKPSKFPGETDAEYQWRLYCEELIEEKSWDQILKDRQEDFKQSVDMNPNGFWETRFVSAGLKRNIGSIPVMEEIAAKDKPTYIKVVSQGLARSDPALIKKVIFMLRDPGSVAKSQERLKRDMKLINPDTMRQYNFWHEVGTVNSPAMFIEVSVVAARWMKMFPEVPIHFVLYNDLISNPHETLAKVQNFLGEGDFQTAASVINPKLKRSYPDLEGNSLREDAEKVFELLKSKDWDGIEKFAMDRKTQTAREVRRWLCVRSMVETNDHICKTCKTKSLRHYRGSAKAEAIAKKIDWRDRPCAYEVAFNLDEPLISIEESIENNFWIDNDSHLKVAN